MEWARIRSRTDHEGTSGSAAMAVPRLATTGSPKDQQQRRRPDLLLVGGIVVVLAVNMGGQVRLNQWHGDFFDVLARRDVFALGGQLLIFLAIIAVLLSLVVGQTWMQEMLKVRLREWLTHDLLDQWLAPGRAYRRADRTGMIKVK